VGVTLARFNRRRLGVFGLLVLTCFFLGVGISNAGWCMPALHAALILATALGTWWLARDDFALNGSGAAVRLVFTGVALGLALTWLAASAAALLGVSAGAHWAHGELAVVFDRFIEDTVRHWTPLGLVAAFVGIGLSIILAEIGGDTDSGDRGQA
jgi:hypothetical protein